MKRLVWVLVVTALPAVCAGDPIVNMLVKHWQTSKAYTIAVAEKMPEDGYSSKPNPAQVSFAEQMAHIAVANASFISTIAGTPSPVGRPERFDKAYILKMLNDSYDFVIKSIGSLTPEQFHKEFDAEGMKMMGLEMLMLADNHTASHRGQCLVYLRVKNIAPPEYQF